ncbi:MAG: aminodeoxychorismate synthase component I [Saprospiraceae bacterium]|nr:aminodeoxychorismate synthase component I [Saprospiraceae bacterium]
MRQPFLFVVDFKGDMSFVLDKTEVPFSSFSFDFNGQTNTDPAAVPKPFIFHKYPIDFAQFRAAFDQIKVEIHAGNSYLTNLTFETPIDTNYNLRELFFSARAKYKLLCDDAFVVFSPETFIKINNGTISAYPMKGTINAAIPNAEKIILSDIKETAEHATIVDLIRNDLSIVAKNVGVKKYRYIDKIITHEKTLLQVSSEISGILPQDYHRQIGTILFSLLPAGSISGAPKAKTVSIINQIEKHNRRFYTGICGYFNGYDLDSGVMIRFIEKKGDQLVFKSGGGITSFSDPQVEYQEYIDKVYVPIY